MSVKRIVANIAADNVAGVRDFYHKIFGLDVVMDFGWVATLAGAQDAPVQVSVASEGGSGTAVPALSIEVDDLEAALDNVRASSIAIEYGPVDEPWGVRRFFVRDPAGTLINVLVHSAQDAD